MGKLPVHAISGGGAIPWELVAEEVFSKTLKTNENWSSAGTAFPENMARRYDLLKLEMDLELTALWTNGSEFTSAYTHGYLVVGGNAILSVAVNAAYNAGVTSQQIWRGVIFIASSHSGESAFYQLPGNGGTGYPMNGLLQARLLTGQLGTGSGAGVLRVWGIRTNT
ncbi:hypothetical protein AAEU42_01115 [Pseudoflavonifractor phocaeensis]|uniref:hypothetical protein n=1 Tax=Pseudoflavonifractor phocaeensis TaxID=1870988 RepID=UPI00313C7C1A